MNNTMEYKGYIGSVEFSEADQILFGKVQGIRSVISYEGTTVSELINDFHGAVDDYLALCAEEGITPEKAFKGSFNVRFKNPDLHRRAAVYAYNHSISLNSVVEESVAEYQNVQIIRVAADQVVFNVQTADMPMMADMPSTAELRARGQQLLANVHRQIKEASKQF